METSDAIILGAVQGLTEFLPVSSSGHLAVGSDLLDIANPDENLTFAVVVHAATALASVIVFRNIIWEILKGLLEMKWNEATQYVGKLAISAIPVVVIGVMFKDKVEEVFSSGNTTLLVGVMWMLTAGILGFTAMKESGSRKVGWLDSILIGIAQAVAVLPGISRSGSTIATALYLGIDRERAARFSFLMVIVPILGIAALDLKKILGGDVAATQVETMPLLAGFVAAFITGLVACYLMLGVVRRGRLPWFSFYLFLAGAFALFRGLEWI